MKESKFKNSKSLKLIVTKLLITEIIKKHFFLIQWLMKGNDG